MIREVKPHIFFLRGRWHCTTSYFTFGVGDTQLQAYEHYHALVETASAYRLRQRLLGSLP